MRYCTPAQLPHNLTPGSLVRQVHNAHCRTHDVPCRPQATASPQLSPSVADGTDGTDPTTLTTDWRLVDKPAVEETASWFLQTYNLKSMYSVRLKVHRAAAALRDLGAPPLSLQDTVLAKAQMLDSLSPGLGWKVFSRYPEEFSHPDAEDLWRIMAAFLYTIGFEPERISLLFRRHPCLFARTVQDPKNLKSLFDWFQHIGLTHDGAVRVINKNPLVLQTNVEEVLKPRFAYIVEGLGVPTAAAVAAIRRCPEVLALESSTLQERVDYLLDIGLTERDVAKIFADQPTVLCSRVEEKLQPVVDVLQHDLGCSGDLLRRMIASSGLLTRSPDTIRVRAALWAKLGVGPELLRAALQRFPRFLLYPMDEPKYKKKIKFLREELGLEPTVLSAYPQFVSYSLPGRVAPRCAAVKTLRGHVAHLPSLAQKEETFLKIHGISQDEYNAFLADYLESDEARRWQEVE